MTEESLPKKPGRKPKEIIESAKPREIEDLEASNADKQKLIDELREKIKKMEKKYNTARSHLANQLAASKFK
jgi:predicted  nucleic acid-binding Zn-ribbon protein